MLCHGAPGFPWGCSRVTLVKAATAQPCHAGATSAVLMRSSPEMGTCAGPSRGLFVGEVL